MINKFDCNNYFAKLSFSKIFIILFVFSFFYILPITLANTFYIDDMNRTTIGYNWNRDGRFMSSVVMHLISNQVEVVYSLFPFSTIFSTFLLAFCGFLLSYLLEIRDKFHLIFASLIFATCPFLLEILTYKFDCLPISLSILCAILPFVFYQNKKIFFLSSLIFLYFIFGFYQTTAFSYVIILFIFLIKDCWNEKFKQIFFNSILALFAFVIAFVFYKISLQIFGITLVDSQRSEFIFGDSNFKNLLIERFKGFIGLINTLLKSSYVYSLYIALITSCFGIFTFLKNKKRSAFFISQILVTIFLTFFILVLAISINLVVKEPRWSPRSLIGFAFVILMLFYATIHGSRIIKSISLAFLPLLFYSFLISSQLGIFLKNQDEYSDFVISLLAPEILKHENLKLVIDGSIKYAPRNATVNYDRMSFIYKLAPLYEHYSFYWGVIRLNKFEMASNDYVFGEERDKILSEKAHFPIIQQNRIFTLRIQKPYAIIQFN